MKGWVPLVALALASSCGDGAATPTPPRPPADLVQLRAVQGSSAPPCRDGAFELADECLVLGPVALDADDIRTARRTATPPTGEALSIVFTSSGDAQYEELATAQLRRRIAVLVDGEVAAAPTVQDERSSGGIVVTGLDEDQLRRVGEGFRGRDS